jgi:hypothetical protein
MKKHILIKQGLHTNFTSIRAFGITMATLNNISLLDILWQAPLPTYLHILNKNLGGTDAITLFDDSSHHRIT